MLKQGETAMSNSTRLELKPLARYLRLGLSHGGSIPPPSAIVTWECRRRELDNPESFRRSLDGSRLGWLKSQTAKILEAKVRNLLLSA